ncbi:MFS-type transporter SLC18B1-like [Haliotis rubra]|uniref:MFS-type transporter SLC18B1-like n=1 Tax=Haliotis rubra TaxID=36100 RepID=UPI001EE55B93|nr:MFS-type transporter SLC18B1-like [Haliotis rubra]
MEKDLEVNERTPILADSVTCNLAIVEKKIANHDENSNEKVDFSFKKLDHKKKLTFVTLAFVNFCACTCFSLLAPFFPREAESKGASQTVVGFIFGCFEFVIFVSSPIFGTFLTRLGPKFVFISGVFVCGSCSVLFGLLDRSPSGTIFIVMCFLCRSVEALGCSAFITASFAIVAYSFPDHVTTVFGTLETFSGLGLMVGPPIGGALYELGGYGLPFWTLGGLCLMCAMSSFFFMPSNDEARQPYKGSVFTLLTSMEVWVTCFSIFCGSFSLGFLDPTLASHLQEFNLSTLVVGFIFLAAPAVYGFTAPIWGWVGDAKGQIKSLMVVGNFMSCVAFLLMGPCPLLPPLTLWLNVISLMMVGLFVGCALIPTITCLLVAARRLGFKENLDTYALVSGLFNSAYCLGTFVGPTLGGVLKEHFGFGWASSLVAAMFLLAGINLSLFICCTKPCCCRGDKRSEYTILEGSNDSTPIGGSLEETRA